MQQQTPQQSKTPIPSRPVQTTSSSAPALPETQSRYATTVMRPLVGILLESHIGAAQLQLLLILAREDLPCLALRYDTYG